MPFQRRSVKSFREFIRRQGQLIHDSVDLIWQTSKQGRRPF